MAEKLIPVMLEPHHLAEVDHLHDVQARFTGGKVDRPNLLREPILLSIGFENHEGKLRGGQYLEAIAEFCMIGNDPDSTELAIGMAEEVCDFLRARGFRWVHCSIPEALQSELGPRLQQVGFQSDRERELVHYVKDLRG